MSDLSLPPGLREVHNRYIIPSFIERTSYGVKESNPYNKMFEERIIFLGVQIDDASANDVMAQLMVLESSDPDRDITIYINSPGGSFTALTAIYDTMQYVKPDIQTVCLGQAASAAAVLLAAGTKGKRRALPHARGPSASPCRPPGCSSTSRRWAAATTARRPTSRSRPTRCCGCAPGWSRRSRSTPTGPWSRSTRILSATRFLPRSRLWS